MSSESVLTICSSKSSKCDYTMFQWQMIPQNISEVHLKDLACQFICWVYFMNMSSPECNEPAMMHPMVMKFLSMAKYTSKANGLIENLK